MNILAKRMLKPANMDTPEKLKAFSDGLYRVMMEMTTKTKPSLVSEITKYVKQLERWARKNPEDAVRNKIWKTINNVYYQLRVSVTSLTKNPKGFRLTPTEESASRKGFETASGNFGKNFK